MESKIIFQEDGLDVVEILLTAVSLTICLVFFPISWFFCLLTVAEYERCVVFR